MLTTQARLAALGGSDLSDGLVRFESMRERARGLAALLAERRRGVERDRGGLLDADLVASLEAEAATVASELLEVEAKARELGPEAQRVSEAEAALVAEREAALGARARRSGMQPSISSFLPSVPARFEASWRRGAPRSSVRSVSSPRRGPTRRDRGTGGTARR